MLIYLISNLIGASVKGSGRFRQSTDDFPIDGGSFSCGKAGRDSCGTSLKFCSFTSIVSFNYWFHICTNCSIIYNRGLVILPMRRRDYWKAFT